MDIFSSKVIENFKKRMKSIIDDDNFCEAYYYIIHLFDEEVWWVIFENMSRNDIIKYSKILKNNKLAPKITKLDSKFKNKFFSKYFTFEEIQKIMKKELNINFPISVIIAEIKCIHNSKNHINMGELELFMRLNFNCDEGINNGDFVSDGVKYEIKTYGGRLRGNSGFGSLTSVRLNILNYISNNKEIQKLIKQNKKDKKGHLQVFPLKMKKGGYISFLIPEIYKHLTSKNEKIEFKKKIIEDFKQLYVDVENVNLISELEKVVDMMLINDLDHITETWKNFCWDYYIAVEKCSYVIILDKEKKGKKIKYKGIYISNDIEHIKKHTDIVQYPTSSNKATPFNVTFAIGYKP